MKKNISQRFYILILGMLFWYTAVAQQTGNIVEYFGKEKIDTIPEGVVIHQFKKGLLLHDAIRPITLFGSNDQIMWQMAMDNFEPPVEGKMHEANVSGYERLFWEAIEADSNGIFTTHPAGSYIYLEIESSEEKNILLDASGHTSVLINGLLHEGDHYDYGYTLIPFTLYKGTNSFLFSNGRFARLQAKLVEPLNPVFFSMRDLTLASLLKDEHSEKWSAIRVVNNSSDFLIGYKIRCQLPDGTTVVTELEPIMPMAVRKMPWRMPYPKLWPENETCTVLLGILAPDDIIVDSIVVEVKIQETNTYHERTFISDIDGSVQYYSIAPSTSVESPQALILSVHGASVEAVNQTRAYTQKDWAHIVAPTNRRPFGFNWEEWGRIDALEVMHQARNVYHTDTNRTYLTGHSMGGHGSWFLGANYPGMFAAVAPAAGYPDVIGYKRGVTDSLTRTNPHFEMIDRAASAGRTLKLKTNYMQSGIYVLHGDSDQVVPVEQARLMREQLGTFHPNFSYYEYPGGTHWYGDHSMDWPPLFDFLKQNRILDKNKLKHIYFKTASPAVSAKNFGLTIMQQFKPYQISTADICKTNDTLRIELDNIRQFSIDLDGMEFQKNPIVLIEGQHIELEKSQTALFSWHHNKWQQIDRADLQQKHPDRYGGFKLAFTHRVMFVYATGGSGEENKLYENKARYDAESFLYKGNFSILVLPDTLFDPIQYADRNIILYGNSEHNGAWDKVLASCPVRVQQGKLKFGELQWESDDLGTYFIYPRSDSEYASVGVVAATGMKGLKACMPADYISGVNGFPDILIFRPEWLKNKPEGLVVSGFFNFDWQIENGDFQIIANELIEGK